MKLLSSVVITLTLGLAACGGKKDAAVTTGSGSAVAVVTGSGSAVAVVVAAGSGSGSGAMMAGSGSASGAMMAGSGTGSGATMAGSSTGSGAMTAGSGSGSGSAAAMAGSGSAAAGSDGDEETAFDKLSHDERVKLMKEHVTPDMKKAFQDFDGKKYANFGCKTCHGKDPAKVKFKMPNPELPKLDFVALKAGKQAPKVAKFMGEVVEPKMAELLGAKPFDMKTMKGFGCLGCHEQKK